MSIRLMKASLVAMALVLAVGLAGCGSGSTEDATTPPAAEDSGTGTEAGDSMEEPVTEDPATLTEEKCSGCHEYDRVESTKLDAAGWESTVDRMIQNGMVITADERSVIIDYLTERDQ